MTFQGNPQDPETERLFVGSSEQPELIEPPSMHDIHEKAENYHQLIHEKGKKLSENFIFGLIPMAGPATEALVEADTAGTALWTGTNVETGEKFNTMGERMKFVAKHEAKVLFGAGKTALDVGLWAIGAGEVQALAKLAKGAESAGKIGKGMKIIKEGGKAAGFLEKIGVKATERVVGRTVSMEAVRIGSKLHKAHKIIRGSEIGYSIASAGKQIIDMTKDPEAQGLLEAHNNEWSAMMTNPETQRELVNSYEGSDFQKLVDTEYTHMQEDPEYAQQVLEQMQAWEAQYRDANAQYEQNIQRQAVPA